MPTASNGASKGGSVPIVPVLVACLIIFLVGWNIYSGATMKTIGIPGLLTIEFGPTATATSPVTSPVPTTNPSPPTIEGRYLMDGNPGRLIVISSDGGNAYSIGEATGSWPWDGNVILDGDQIIGQAFEKNTPASFKLEGTVLDDKRIVIAYKFITDGAGRDATGRVDDHILTPVI